ncbi:peptide transporter ATP-binding protein [Sulfolobales archaeon HS-7]|nr:peptide transporter ATP-binding protein [Sulfolobales archaeon HS-7]
MKKINLDINEGESLAIIGESGAGKTTLGRVLVGLQRPDAGEYLYDNINVWKNRRAMKRLRKEVQYIYQDPISSLNPSKTIYESMSFPLRKQGLRGDALRERVSELLKEVGLNAGEVESRYPSQLSGGQLQRVNIARALSVNPRVLIADEPVTMLDASYRIGIIDLLVRLKKERNLTLVFITHDLAISRYLDYRISGVRGIVMYGGIIVERGDLNSLIKNPRHPYSQYLVNSTIDIVNDGELQSVSKSNVENITRAEIGCPYSTHCPFVMEKCKEKEPLLMKIEENREVACYIYGG